jgi:hypothetical protein
MRGHAPTSIPKDGRFGNLELGGLSTKRMTKLGSDMAVSRSLRDDSRTKRSRRVSLGGSQARRGDCQILSAVSPPTSSGPEVHRTLLPSHVRMGGCRAFQDEELEAIVANEEVGLRREGLASAWTGLGAASAAVDQPRMAIMLITISPTRENEPNAYMMVRHGCRELR